MLASCRGGGHCKMAVFAGPDRFKHLTRNDLSMHQRLTGLIAAAYTPMHSDGTLHLDVVPQMVDHLVNSGVSGIYVGGSTGEGMSLTSAERRYVAEAYVTAARGRLKTIIQVGHWPRQCLPVRGPPWNGC